MMLASVNGFIHSAVTPEDTKGSRVNSALGLQETQGCINVTFHDLLLFRCRFLYRPTWLPTEATEIECQHVISSGVEHGRKVIIDLTIRIALVQQKHTRRWLICRIQGSFQCESIGSIEVDVSFLSTRGDHKGKNEHG